MRNILILNWRGPDHPQAGGAEVYLTEMARRWIETGAMVTMVCAGGTNHPFTHDEHTTDKLKVLTMGNQFTIFLLMPFFLLWRGRNYDAILDTANGIPFFAPLFTRTPVTLLFFHVHRLQWYKEFKRPLASFGWFLESKVIPLLYRNHPIMTISCTSKSALKLMGIDPRQIWVVHPGSPQQHKALKLTPYNHDILYVGRLKKYKRVHLLVQAVDQLRGEFPTVHLHIVGRGPELRLLQSLIHKLDLHNHTTLHGYLNNCEKEAIFSRSSVFVTASEVEGWGLTVVEANSQGLPVVAYEAPGLIESVQHEVSGLLVPSDAPVQTFANTIGQILRDPDLRERLARGGQNWAKRFDWDESASYALWILEHGRQQLHQRRERSPVPHRHPVSGAMNMLNNLPGRPVVFASFAGTSLINYGFGLLMAALLLPGDFGLLAFAQTILLLAGLVLNSGYAWALTAALPRAEHEERGRLVRGMLISNFLLAIVLSIILIILFATGLLRAGLEQWSVTLLIAASFPFLATISIGRSTMRGIEAFGSMGIIQVSEVAIKLLAGLALVAVGYGPNGAVAGFLIGAVVAAFLSLVLIAHELDISFLGKIAPLSPLGVSSMFAAVLGMSLLLNLDIMAVKLFAGAARALVGHYQAAIILANVPYFMTTALLAVLFPQLAAVGSLARSVPRLGETLRLIVLFLIPVELALAFVPEFFLTLFFPDSYAAGAPILRILAFGNIALILAATFSNAFLATGHARVPATILLLIVTFEAIGLFLWVPVGQATAAARLFSIGGLLAFLLLASIYLHHQVDFEFNNLVNWLGRYLVALGLAIVAGFFIQLLTGEPVIALFMAIPVYGIMLVISGLWPLRSRENSLERW